MLHLTVLIIHLIAATIWVGGHLVLLFTVFPRALRRWDAQIILDFEHGYERIGIPSLIIQVVTGLWMAYMHRPELAAWFNLDDPTGRAITAKLTLLGLTVLIAIHARFRIIRGLTAERLKLLGWHIVAVSLLSILFVIVGATFRIGGLG